MSQVGSMVVEITGDIKDLQGKLAQASSSTEKFVSKTKEAGAALNTFGKTGSQSIFNLTEKLKELQSNVFTEKDRSKIKLYNAEIQATEKEIAALSSIGTSSFGNLGQSAGKAFSALRQIAYILPGVGLAGILAFATGPIIDYVSSLFGVTAETKRAKEESDKFKDSLKEIEANGIATGLSLQGFVDIARDQTQSIKTRNEALKEANKIMGEHGEKLTLVNIATKAVTEEINKFTEATIEQALATKFADRLADIIIKQRDAQKELNKAILSNTAAQKQLNEVSNIRNLGEGNPQAAARAFLSSTQRGVASAQAVLETLNGTIKELTGDLSDAQLKSVQLLGALGTKDKTDGAVKGVKTIKDVIAELGRELDFLSTKGLVLGDDQSVQKIAAITSTIEKLIRDFNVAPDDTILAKLIGTQFNDLFGNNIAAALKNIDDLKIRIAVKEKIQTAVKAPSEIIIPIIPKITIPNGAIEPQFEALSAKATGLAQQLGVDIAVAMGDAIGGALAGKGGNVFGAFFATIFKSLGSAVRQLGIYAITTSKLIMAIRTTIGKPLGIAGGIALVAIGTAISLAASKIKLNAFANGVQNFGGGLALVGERGPELVSLPAGSSVTPNHALGAISGGGGMVPYILRSEVSGKHLRMVLTRADQSISNVG